MRAQRRVRKNVLVYFRGSSILNPKIISVPMEFFIRYIVINRSREREPSPPSSQMEEQKNPKTPMWEMQDATAAAAQPPRVGAGAGEGTGPGAEVAAAGGHTMSLRFNLARRGHWGKTGKEARHDGRSEKFPSLSGPQSNGPCCPSCHTLLATQKESAIPFHSDRSWYWQPPQRAHEEEQSPIYPSSNDQLPETCHCR